MLNRYSFIGNLGRDADIRTLDSGTQAISFTVAVTESWKDKAGQKQERTTWVNCTKWVIPGGSTALANYLKKGQKVLVEGKPEARPYVTKDQQAAASLEVRVDNVELLGAPAGQQATPVGQPVQQRVQQAVQQHAVPASSQGWPMADNSNDGDLPF